MSISTRAIGRFFLRLFMAMIGLAFVIEAGFVMYLFIGFFNLSSYRFVAIFLLLIVLSNALAKIARFYIEV